MGNSEDAVLNNIELIPDDTSNKEIINLLYKALDEIAGLRSEIIGLNLLVTKPQLVNKKYGRHRCKMYYMDKEISDKELKDLKKQLKPAEILKDFKYINEYNEIILGSGNSQSKQLCRNMIANRTR